MCPVVWEITPIILDLNQESLGLGMAMLEELGHAPVGKFRRLKIKSLNPSKEPHPPNRVLLPNDEGDFVVVSPVPEDTDEILEARTRLPEILPKALSALKGQGR
ncbi:hypothetical protein PM082_013859 [Marasmius tenuissimus]|nr:hypothetical protein PM082_013859 [Marasmius tenuissimus]